MIGTWRDASLVAIVAAGAAAVVWVAATVGGVDVVVGSGTGTRDVGLVSVVVTAVVVAMAGAGLLHGLARRVPRARQVWTWIALAVWIVSFAGPVGAPTPSAGLTLAALHVVVGAVVILGLRRPRDRTPDGVA